MNTDLNPNKTAFAPKVIRIKKKEKSNKKEYATIYDSRFLKNQGENRQLLDRCRNLWDNLAPTRKARTRARKYYTGDQWHELVLRPEGNGFMREEEYIKAQGRIPFKQNMIFQLVNNILGQYRNNPTKTMVVARDREKQIVGEMLTNAIQSVGKVNFITDLDAKNLLDFFLSGIAITKSYYDYFPQYNKYDVFVKNVNLNNIFFNANIDDPRIEFELNIIGEIVDVDINAIIGAFAKTKEEEQIIRQIYGTVGAENSKNSLMPTSQLDPSDKDNMDFYISSDMSLCRFYEVWEKRSEWRIRYHDYADATYGTTTYSEEEIRRINKERILQGQLAGIAEDEIALIEYEHIFESFWVAKYLTPWGHCLHETETPYAHEEHPYNIVMKAIDGQPLSIVSTIIDQQRYINRLINLLDQQLGNSAKNMLIVPEQSIPDGMDLDDYTKQWSSPSGVVKVNLDPQNQYAKPFVLSSSSVDSGANNLLSLQMQLMNQISGVGSAMQGHTASAGTPAALYAQEAQNSSANIKDMLEIFNSLLEKRDMKILKLIKQFYTEPRVVRTVGRKSDKIADMYDPELAYGVDTELAASQGMDTPAFRQLSDSTLMQLFQMQAIDIETYLENTSLPNADKILESVRKQREKMQEQQAAMMPSQAPAQNNPQA